MTTTPPTRFVDPADGDSPMPGSSRPVRSGAGVPPALADRFPLVAVLSEARRPAEAVVLRVRDLTALVTARRRYPGAQVVPPAARPGPRGGEAAAGAGRGPGTPCGTVLETGDAHGHPAGLYWSHGEETLESTTRTTPTACPPTPYERWSASSATPSTALHGRGRRPPTSPPTTSWCRPAAATPPTSSWSTSAPPSTGPTKRWNPAPTGAASPLPGPGGRTAPADRLRGRRLVVARQGSSPSSPSARHPHRVPPGRGRARGDRHARPPTSAASRTGGPACSARACSPGRPSSAGRRHRCGTGLDGHDPYRRPAHRRADLPDDPARPAIRPSGSWARVTRHPSTSPSTWTRTTCRRPACWPMTTTGPRLGRVAGPSSRPSAAA